MINQSKRIVIITEDSEPDKSIKGHALPAQSVFSGLYREVRAFSEKLNTILPTDVLIISSKYGVIDKDTIIDIYDNKILKGNAIEEFDKKTSFVKQLSEKVKDASIIILLLPVPYLRYLEQSGWITNTLKNHKIIVVAGSSLEKNLHNNTNITYLERKGVSRIGLRNQKIIIDTINAYKNE